MDNAAKYITTLMKAYIRRNYRKAVYSKEYSYRIFAVNELINRLSNTIEPPLVVLERFRDRMAIFATYRQDTKAIFHIAEEMADHFICMIT